MSVSPFPRLRGAKRPTWKPIACPQDPCPRSAITAAQASTWRRSPGDAVSLAATGSGAALLGLSYMGVIINIFVATWHPIGAEIARELTRRGHGVTLAATGSGAALLGLSAELSRRI